MTILYMFSPMTGEYVGSRHAQNVGGKELTISAHATTQQPPDDIPPGHAIRWTGSAWEIVEDHRQNVDSTGIKSGGTPYWLPDEDDWQSSPRYMEELGPLPTGAVTTRLEKPAPTLEEARAAFDAECAVFAADSEPHTVKLERVCYTFDTDADEYTACDVLETLEVREE